MTDFTIIIQGPLHPVSISNIDNYLKFGKVIVSCWLGDADQYLTEEAKKAGATIIQTDETTLLPSFNISNVYKQAISTLNGATIADTDFVIKTRSDERYSELSVAMEKMLANPDKIVTDSRAHRDSFLKFFLSDHFLIMKKDLCVKAFSILKKRLENPTFEYDIRAKGSWNIFGVKVNPYSPDSEFGGDTVLYPEQMITLAILEAKGLPLDPARSKELMLNNFEVIPLKSLGKVKWRPNALNGIGYDENFPPSGPNSIQELIG